MSRDLIRFMQSFFAPTLIECQPAGWCPPADIYRTTDGWLLKLELAGVRPEDIEVEAAGQRLRVDGMLHINIRTEKTR